MFQSPSLINHLLHKDFSTLIYCAKCVNWLTDRCKTTSALSDCSAASNEPNNEKEGSNCNNGHCWDESVHVFKEMIVVIVCNEDVGSNIAQDACSGLRVTETSTFHSSRTTKGEQEVTHHHTTPRHCKRVKKTTHFTVHFCTYLKVSGFCCTIDIHDNKQYAAIGFWMVRHT